MDHRRFLAQTTNSFPVCVVLSIVSGANSCCCDAYNSSSAPSIELSDGEEEPVRGERGGVGVEVAIVCCCVLSQNTIFSQDIFVQPTKKSICRVSKSSVGPETTATPASAASVVVLENSRFSSWWSHHYDVTNRFSPIAGAAAIWEMSPFLVHGNDDLSPWPPTSSLHHPRKPNQYTPSFPHSHSILNIPQ